jgi:hypothetical protein
MKPRYKSRSVSVLLVVAFAAVYSLQAAPAPKQKLTASAIQIEQVDVGDIQIPMEFRLAIYENLLDRVRKSGKFQQVYRSGDHQAEGVKDLVTLRTKLQKFQEGSRTKREVTTVAGATKIDVNTTVTAHDGQVLLDKNIEGKVRFFGENLGATNDVAKRVTKILVNNF